MTSESSPVSGPPGPVPLAGAPSAAEKLRRYLRDVGYTELGCCAELGLRDARKLAQVIPLELDPVPRRVDSALSALVGMFFRRQKLAADALRHVVPSAQIATLIEAGIVAEARTGRSPTLAANLALFPCRDLLVVTDWPVVTSRGNPVMALHPAPYDLVKATSRRPVDMTLDLCCGSGVHALAAAGHSRGVIGVDNSPRAISFARFNAWLSRIDNVEFVEGSLYEPLPRQMRYELVIANPPYNLTLFSPPGTNFWSGGRSGEEVLRPLMQGLPSALSENGVALVLALLADRIGDECLRRVERWVAGACDLLFWVDDITDPIQRMAEKERNRDFHEPLRQIARFARSEWDRQGVVGFKFGIVNLRRRQGSVGGRRVAPFRATVVEPTTVVDVREAMEPLGMSAPRDRPATDGAWSEPFEELVRAHLPDLDGADPLAPDSGLVSLGLDSLQAAGLLTELETAFCITIPDEALAPDIMATPATLWAAFQDAALAQGLSVTDPASRSKDASAPI